MAINSASSSDSAPVLDVKQYRWSELAVKMCKYPPLGSRGACLARAQGYGENFDAYVQNANADTLLIVQIEHKDAVANIEEILSVPGIDGTFIGPYDLSLSLGIPGQLGHPEVLAAKQKVRDTTIACGLIAGVHLVQPSTAADHCRQAVTEGYRFIALGTDILFLGDSARVLKHEVDRIEK